MSRYCKTSTLVPRFSWWTANVWRTECTEAGTGEKFLASERSEWPEGAKKLSAHALDRESRLYKLRAIHRKDSPAIGVIDDPQSASAPAVLIRRTVAI